MGKPAQQRFFLDPPFRFLPCTAATPCAMRLTRQAKGAEPKTNWRSIRTKEFNKHVQDAAEMFLKRRGCEILDTNWECPDGGGKFDIIAEDEDSVVFVQVKGRDGRVEGFGFDEATMQRDDFERMSMSYLAENPDICNCAVRFDVVAITVVGEDRAMIRHHINAMSYGLSEE